jgi:hypothetical protein
VTTLIVPRAERASLYPTLGSQVIADIERWSVFGPGSLAEQPARLDDEKKMLILRFYEIYPIDHPRCGQRVFDRCVIELRKGVAKTELAAWITHVELHPWSHVRFNGFDEHGELLPGRAVRSPYIPMLATAEEQVQELAFGVLKFIVDHSDTADLFSTSLEKIIRLGDMGSNDGMAVPVSNAPSTRDGARTTFQHFDEPHWLVLPREKMSVEAMLENVHKRQLETPWTLYTSTAGTPGMGSVEEDVRNEAERIDEGKQKNSRLFFFARWAGDSHDDLSTVEKRIEAIKEATGPAGEWGDGQFLRIAADYDRGGCDRMYWERVYLNRWRKSNAGAYNIEKVKGLLRPDERLDEWAFVTIGFDGAKFKDSTAIVATEIPTGRQQLLALWEKPDNEIDWEVPTLEVMDTMAWIFQNLDVWRVYADPAYWTEVIATWAGKWPDRVVEFWTNRQQRKVCDMVKSYKDAIDAGTVTFVGPEERQQEMFTHIAHAGRRELKITDELGQPLWLLQKLDGLPQNKFDACMAGNLSWQARLDAIAENAQPRGRFNVPRRLY